MSVYVSLSTSSVEEMSNINVREQLKVCEDKVDSYKIDYVNMKKTPSI